MAEPFTIGKEFIAGGLTKPLSPDSQLPALLGGLSHAEGVARGVNILKRGW